MINKNVNIYREFFYVYFFSYLAAPLAYFIKIILAKNLSVEQFGILFAIIGFFGLISIFNDLGMSETLNYFGVKFFEKDDFYSLKISFYYSIIMQTLTSIFITIILFLFGQNLLKNFFGVLNFNIFFFFFLYFIFLNLTKPIKIIFNVSKKYSYNNVFTFFEKLLTLIFILIFVFLNLDFKYIGLIFFLPIFILSLIYLHIIFSKDFCNFKKYKFKFDLKLYKKLLRYAFYVFLGSGATLLLGRIDVLFITYFLEIKYVGFYEIALLLAFIISILLTPIVSYLTPLTKSFIEEGKKKSLSILLSNIYKIFFILGLPLCIVFTQFPNEIILFLFGQKFIESSTPLVILSIGVFFCMFFQINFPTLAGLGKVKQRNFILYAAGILNIVLNYFLIQIWGIIGVCISTTIVFIFLSVVSYLLNLKYGIYIKIELLKILKIIFSNIIFFMIVYYLKLNIFFNLGYVIFGINIDTLIKLIVICFISFTIYFSMVFLLKIIDFKSFEKLILQKVFLIISHRKK